MAPLFFCSHPSLLRLQDNILHILIRWWKGEARELRPLVRGVRRIRGQSARGPGRDPDPECDLPLRV